MDNEIDDILNDIRLEPMSFDLLYFVLDRNFDFEQGKVLGGFVEQKFAQLSPDASLPFLSTGLHDPNLASRKNVDNLFDAHQQNLAAQNKHVEETLELMCGLQDYKSGNMLNDHKMRDQGLQRVKQVLTPYFSDDLAVKPHEPKKKKGLLKRVFG